MKSKLPLIMAAIIGILALLAVRSYVNKMQEQTQAQLKGDLVVCARRDIPKDAEITMDMLVQKSVPRQFISSQAVKVGDDVKVLLGSKARYPIPANQIISWTDVEMEPTRGLSAIIPEGQRAFTIPVAKGLRSSMLQPGDHIDILGSFASPKPNQPMPSGVATWRQSSDMVNVVLLQNVTVLALGDVLGPSGTTRSEAGGGADLTLSLSLQEAQMLMFAGEHGELGAVLRRWESIDTLKRADLPRITFEAVEKIIGDLDDERQYRTVEIQRGSKTTPVPVTNPK
jgi:Flp pilus assembly protein CpaB